jgi:hypothetical protein
VWTKATVKVVELFAKFDVLLGVRTSRMRLLVVIVVLGAALAACTTQDPHPAAIVARGTVNANSGNYSIKASPAEFTAGQKVEVTVTISGPIRYQTGCVTPLAIRVSDTSLNDIWNPPYNPQPCSVGEAGPPTSWHNLPAGQTASFTEVWPSSAKLATGTYYVSTTFMLETNQGNVPHSLPTLKVKVVSS